MGKNVFTNRPEAEGEFPEEINENEILLRIMQQEFPNDIYYKNGTLGEAKEITAQTNTIVPIVSPTSLGIAPRNEMDILQIDADVSQSYAKYDINKLYPSVPDDDLDEILDDEFSYFLQDGTPTPPAVDGLFLISEETNLNPPDYHDIYITKGPSRIMERIGAGEDPVTVVNNTFCVWFIQNSTALPIPNYKTLEVMLVERGKSYDAVLEATPEELLEFDMKLDGRFSGDMTEGPADPVEEFKYRQVLDRSVEWSLSIRLASGYSVGNDPNGVPFERDPADYLLPAVMRGSSTTLPGGWKASREWYFPKVYNKQTIKEIFRAQYEGQLVILQWPARYNNDIVQNSTFNTLSDDLIFDVRFMIHGFWKQVLSLKVFKLIARMNGIDIASFDTDLQNPVVEGELNQVQYDALSLQNGIINTMIENGGISVLAEQEDVDGSVWESFPHIAEIDRLDYDEYVDYIENWSNGRDPYAIPEHVPYEPPGSIAYLPQERVNILQVQANEQAKVDAIKDQIEEQFPQLAVESAQLEEKLSNQPDGYLDYCILHLGTDSSIHDIFHSGTGKWQYLKQKRNGKIKHKGEQTDFMTLLEKENGIFSRLNRGQETSILFVPASRGVHINVKKGASIINNLNQMGADSDTPLFDSNMFNAFEKAGNVNTSKDDQRKYGLPRGAGGDRRNQQMKDRNYFRGTLATWLFMKRIGNGADALQSAPLGPDGEDDISFMERCKRMDQTFIDLKSDIADISAAIAAMDNRIINATSLVEFQDIFNTIAESRALIASFDEYLFGLADSYRVYVEDTKNEVIKTLYNDIEYARAKTWSESKKKYFIMWPSGAANAVTATIKGKSFTGHQPSSELLEAYAQ